MGLRRIDFTRIASFLGISTDELRTQLAGGKSLAVIATEQGKTAKDLVTTILAPYKEHQQVNVKYGYISQAEADAMYQLRAVRTENMISRPMPPRAAAPRGGLGMRFEGFPGRGKMGRGQAGGLHSEVKANGPTLQAY